MRLNRYLASSGVAARRKCDEMILAGRVRVNGKVVGELGTKIEDGIDFVEVDGKPVSPPVENRYFLLNKPRKTISAVSDDRRRRTVIDLLGESTGLHPVGRLDYDTTGVLLITDDGELTNLLTHPSFGIEREYMVLLDREVSEKDLDSLRSGIELEDGPVMPASVERSGGKRVKIVLKEGRNRVVRRIFSELDYKVLSLHRTKFAGMGTGALKPGEWRKLSIDEISNIKRIIGWT